jgi:hypothetical protein
MPEAAFEAVEPDVADTAVRREESSRVLKPDLLAADMLLDKDSTELGKRRGRRAILEDPEQERTLADVQAKNADVSAVRAFEAVGQGVAIDELRELEDVGAGNGKAGEVHRRHGALVPSGNEAGSAAGNPETTSVAA